MRRADVAAVRGRRDSRSSLSGPAAPGLSVHCSLVAGAFCDEIGAQLSLDGIGYLGYDNRVHMQVNRALLARFSSHSACDVSFFF